MTTHEALPPTTGHIYGKADWIDYTDYWRELDAEWIQDRIVLRTPNAASRDAMALPAGSLVYNEALDMVELRSKAGAGVYKTLTPLPTSLRTTDTGTTATIYHNASVGNLGLTFTSTEVGVTSNFNARGVLTVDSGGVTVKTGTRTARLTTSTSDLVSDSPVSAPGITITGVGAISASGRPATVGALTAASATVTGILTAGAGTNIANITFNNTWLSADAGMVSQWGYFHGDGSGGLMSWRSPSTGGWGPYVQTLVDRIQIGGGSGNTNPPYFDVYIQPRVMAMPIQYYYGGVGIWNFAPSFYSAGDPGAQYFPDGTIWVQ